MKVRALVTRGTATRDRLISTAADLFATQGYGQTGVTEIMQNARATSGSFYHFFPAKEDLLLAVVDHVGETTEAEGLPAAGEDEVEPIRRIFDLARYYRTRLLESRFTIGSAMGTLAAELSESHPEVRTRLAERYGRLASRLEALLREAGDRLPADLDRSAFAQFILATIEGGALLARVRRSIDPFDTAIAQLQACLRSLTRESGGGEAIELEPGEGGRRETASRDWRAW